MANTDHERPCVVLLLPVKLEAFEHRAVVESLLGTEGVVAVDPPPVSYARQARWRELLGVLVAQRQAKRLRKKLPARATALVFFHPGQYRLARSFVAAEPECELLYGPPADDRQGRLGELHLLATERAEVVFAADGGALRAAVDDALR